MEPSVPQTDAVPHRRESRRLGFGLRLHHLLFIGFILVAGVPIAVLALWEGRTSFQN